MFTVLPAIDLTHGRLGSYAADGPVPSEAFDGDPLRAAASFVAAGATWVHVVDMDLAFNGAVANDAVVGAIRTTFPGISIQVSGGIREPDHAAAFLAVGADRIVIGSAALADGATFEAVARASAGRHLVGIEVGEGRIRSRGRDAVDLDLMETLGWLTAGGAPGFVVTAVGRVGSAAGPDTAVIKRVVRAGRPTMAAGGIASLADLQAVHRAGTQGAVVGRGALEGTLPLGEALTWAAEH